MSILHIIGIIILYILFMLVKKSDKKQSFIKWGVIFWVLLLGLNITISMILSQLDIIYNLSVITGVYIFISAIFTYIIFKTNEFQKYELNKFELVLTILVIALVVIVVLKERDFFSGEMKFGVTDAAIHYKAAKHFSYYFDTLVNIPDKTAYDFNYMQTGAYITDGIFMKVVRDVFGMKDYYIYNIYETFIYLLNGLLFVTLISNFVNNKYKCFITHILVALYMCAYTYEAYLMGFSYLSLGLVFILGILNILLLYFDKDKNKLEKEENEKLEENTKKDIKNMNRVWMFISLGLLACGLIFSYSLYVPVLFSTIVIIFFAKGIIDKKKRILKIVDVDTLIVFTILMAITIFGAMYLLIPTYLNPNVEDLGSAIANYGYVQLITFYDYIYFIPFVIMFIIFSIKNKENLEIVIFEIFALIFTFVMYFLNSKELVSDYYLSKVYFYDWIILYVMNIYAVCAVKDKAIKRVIVFYITAVIFLIGIGIYVDNNPDKFEERELHTAGMYYYENRYRRDFIDRRYTFTKGEIELSEHIKEIDDLNIDNTLFFAKNNYHIYWVWSIADFKESKDTTNLFVNFADDYKNDIDKLTKYDYIIILEEEGNKEDYLELYDIIFENSTTVLMKRK